MRQRRHHGATMGLVVICILVIAVLGVGAYFLIKMMGGGREIANATDAGVLNVAKHVIRDARVPTPAGYEDCEYPLGCGYINLLTYNRCVARAIMVASNAENMTGPGSYKANAQKALSDLAAAGRALTQKIVDSNKYFDQVNNSVHMASFVGVKDSGPCALAYMKPNGSTNVFFSDGQIMESVFRCRPGSHQRIHSIMLLHPSHTWLVKLPLKYLAKLFMESPVSAAKSTPCVIFGLQFC